MTREELEKKTIINDGQKFDPIYSRTEIEIIKDNEIIKTYDYTIIVTAQEVYQVYLAQKNATPQQTIEERLTQLEVLQVNTMSLQIQNQILGGQI